MGLEKDIKLGSDGDVDFALADGKLVIKLTFAKALPDSDTDFAASVSVKQGAKPILDKIIALVPAGWVHDALAKAEAAALAAIEAPVTPVVPGA